MTYVPKWRRAAPATVKPKAAMGSLLSVLLRDQAMALAVTHGGCLADEQERNRRVEQIVAMVRREVGVMRVPDSQARFEVSNLLRVVAGDAQAPDLAALYREAQRLVLDQGVTLA